MDPVATIQTLFEVVKAIYEEIKLLQENAAYLQDLLQTLQNIEAILGKLDVETKNMLEPKTLGDIEEIARAIHDMLSKSARKSLARRGFDFVWGNSHKQKEVILELHRNLRDKMDMLHLDVSASGQKQILAEIKNMRPEQSLIPMAWKADARDITFSRDKTLGRGGVANTFAGTYRSEEVAVKLPREEVLRDFLRNSTKREREVDILFRLHHPNIVSCLGGVGADGPPGLKFCVIMEKLECTLQQAIENSRLPQHSTLQGSMTARLQVCLGVCQGVAFLHAHTPYPMLHRDLNPSNVMLDKSGTAKIIDFGNAKEEQGGAHSTQVVATPGWIAPEVESGDAKQSEASDVYALALLCFVASACIELGQYLPVSMNRVAIEGSMDRLGLSASVKTPMLNGIFNKGTRRPAASALVQAFKAETQRPTPQVHGPAHGGGSEEVDAELAAMLAQSDISSVAANLAAGGFKTAADVRELAAQAEIDITEIVAELGLKAYEKMRFKNMLKAVLVAASSTYEAVTYKAKGLMSWKCKHCGAKESEHFGPIKHCNATACKHCGAKESEHLGPSKHCNATATAALTSVRKQWPHIPDASGVNLPIPGEWGRTALHRCAYVGELAQVKNLILLRANPNALPRDKATPLMLAAINDGCVEVARALVEAGASRHHKDVFGDTALRNARKYVKDKAKLKEWVDLLTE